jgi:hypothetical protein
MYAERRVSTFYEIPCISLTMLKCDNADLGSCYPIATWITDFFNANSTRATLGVPDDVEFQFVSMPVFEEFIAYGDQYVRYSPPICHRARIFLASSDTTSCTSRF